MSHHHIDSTHTHLLFDRSIAPIVHVRSGDTVTFQTLDACWGEVRSTEQFMHYREHNPRGGSNPLTGPVFVEGAQPGGGLAVEILKINLAAEGFQIIGPNRGIIRDEVRDWTVHRFQAESGYLRLPTGLTLPTDPVIGELGNAPLGSPTNRPNPCGGNLDVPQIGIGATVYLPVEIAGGIFSLGDVHARQGDGELVGAPEIGASVTVRLTVLERRRAALPVVERGEVISVCATAATEAEALRTGAFEAARLLQGEYGMTFETALFFLTMTAQLRCSRTGLWGDHGPVITISFSKELIPKSMARP